MKKAFIGSRLRQLRRERDLTQAALAEVLGISAAYVNMLEKNQRSLSVPVLMALSEQFGIDWHDVVPDSGSTVLADLRTAIRDPLFTDETPDLDELRAAIDHTPMFVQSFLKLYQITAPPSTMSCGLAANVFRLTCSPRRRRQPSTTFPKPGQPLRLT